jgi:hypothetical protein
MDLKPHRYAIAALLLGQVGAAAAQEPPGTWYMLAGPLATQMGGARDGESVVYAAAPGGTALGWQLGGGAFISSKVSLEAECASSGVVEAVEPSRYGMTFHQERRDRFFGVNVRFHVRLGRRVDVEPLVGVALMRQDSWSQTEYHDWPVPAPGSPIEWGPRERLDSVTAGALSAGLDLRLGGRRFALVPSIRIRKPFREPESPRSYDPAVSLDVSLAAGILVRIGL